MLSKLSVVINTLNEEKNIANAINSVKKIANEVIVVDMHSDDRTAEIASSLGAKVYFYERIKEFDIARKFAVDKASNSWVLLLDADEVVSETLRNNIKLWVQPDSGYDCYILPYENYLIGDKIEYTGWGDESHLRLFRKEKVKFTAQIHNYKKISKDAKICRVSRQDGSILHFNYISINHFVEKLNKYTDIEALQKFKSGEKHSFSRMVAHSIKEFFSRYIFKKGYKDGWRGFYLSILMFNYRCITYAKLKELHENKDDENVLKYYQDIVDKNL